MFLFYSFKEFAADLTGIYDAALICLLMYVSCGRMENFQFFLYLFMGLLLWHIMKPLTSFHHLINFSSISMINEV